MSADMQVRQTFRLLSLCHMTSAAAQSIQFYSITHPLSLHLFSILNFLFEKVLSTEAITQLNITISITAEVDF